MTPLQIIEDRRLLDQVIEIMRERNLFHDYHLFHERELHNSDIMKMCCLLDWTVLEYMSKEQLAADYGLERIEKSPVLGSQHDLSSSWLDQHIAATRR